MILTSNKFLAAFLVLSLAANVFFVGHMFGEKAQHHKRMHKPLTETNLTDDKKQLLKNAMKKQRQEFKHYMPLMKKNRQDLFKILSAEDFDAEAYRRKTTEMLQIREQLHLNSVEAVEDLAGQLSQQERKQLMHFLNRLERGPGVHDRKPGRERPRRN